MSVLGAILAGGRSSRFGSDKALAVLDGRPLIEIVASSLSAQCDALVIVGRKHAAFHCIDDRPQPDMGPLAGLAGALAYAADAGFDQVLSLGVDTLGIPTELRARLEPAPAYVANQPIIGLWPVAALPLLDAILASDERHSMRHFIERLGARSVAFESPPSNINTPADLDTLSRMPVSAGSKRIEAAINQLDRKDSLGIDAAWAALRPLGFAVVPYLRAAYGEFRHGEGRCALVYYATRYARIGDDALALGVAALEDRSKQVRYRACGLLAYSLRREALGPLRARLSDKYSLVSEAAAAAIQAIEAQDHNLFVDRSLSGRSFWVVNPGDEQKPQREGWLARISRTLGLGQ